MHFMTAYEATFPGRPAPVPLDMIPLQSLTNNINEILPDQPIIDLILHEWDTKRFSCSADALAEWLNSRWKKSGYQLSAETVCEVLRSNGRIAFRGQRDSDDGKFMRGKRSSDGSR